MPIRDIDLDKIEACEDVPEAPRKKKSEIMSVIGIVLLCADIIGMSIIRASCGIKSSWPISIRIVEAILEIGCIASLVLLFVAFKYHRKNTRFRVFMWMWIAYLIWFVIAMSTNIPFV